MKPFAILQIIIGTITTLVALLPPNDNLLTTFGGIAIGLMVLHNGIRDNKP